MMLLHAASVTHGSQREKTLFIGARSLGRKSFADKSNSRGKLISSAIIVASPVDNRWLPGFQGVTFAWMASSARSITASRPPASALRLCSTGTVGRMPIP